MAARIGKYEILDELGKGGMGTVYRARDPLIGRMVALKMINRDLVGSREAVNRFFQEAQSAGSLQHPNIVTVYDLGESDGVPYIVMEYLEGHTLDRFITRAMRVRLVHKIRYMLEVCRGLQYAHSRHVIHRDIKPSNIFVTNDGTVKILDFGIARINDPAGARRQQTQAGMIVGTMEYLSPEQLRAEPPTAATDIWAVGVTTYELLSYRKPFEAEGFAQLVQSVLQKEPRSLRELVPECPVEVEEIVAKMMRKSAQDRYQTMDDVVPELDRTYRTMSAVAVQELLDDSHNKLAAQDIGGGMEALREVLQIERGNTQAKKLLEDVSAKLQDSSVTAQLQALIEKAKAILQQGRTEEARQVIESALQIDPGYGPALNMLKQLKAVDDRSQRIKDLLEQASAELGKGDDAAVESAAKQILAIQGDNQEALRLLEKATSQRSGAGGGVTKLGGMSPPTGFFAGAIPSHTSFFQGDQVRYEKIQESLKFYRDHLNTEYQTLSSQARLTYYLWIASVVLGLGTLVGGVALLFLGKFAAGSVSAISTTFVYFIQRVFQQREDHYRALAAAKYEHLEYGNHWLLVIQSIDGIENPQERQRRQGDLVDVLTRKLESRRSDPERPRGAGPVLVKRKKKSQPAGG